MRRTLLPAALAVLLAACESAPPPVAAEEPRIARDAQEVTRLLPAIPLRLERCAVVDPDDDVAYRKERQRYLQEHRRLEEIAYRVAARTTGNSLAVLRGVAQAVAVARAEREFGGELPSRSLCRALLTACQSRDADRCQPIEITAPAAVRAVLAAAD